MVFVVLEGCSSLTLFARSTLAAARPLFAEEVSTQYDREFGWVAKKSFSAPNFYGPGIGLNTNSRGFRGTMPVADAVPNGKMRIVCSGDSFTLGWGVADQQTWCARLASDRVESVNMGQGGYGVDQAFLWYKRDGLTLDHDVQILAFVTHDFLRMAMDSFIGFGKPRLVVDGDSLRSVGVPVPRSAQRRFTMRFPIAVRQLRMSQLLASLTKRIGGQEGDEAFEAPPPPEARGTRAVFAHLVSQLKRINAAKQSRLVLVYLPSLNDFTNDGALRWRTAARVIADSLDVPYIDLIPALRQLERADANRLYFDSRATLSFAGAVGHLTAAGNAWVAEVVRARLDSLGVLPNDAVAARRTAAGATATAPSLARAQPRRSFPAPRVPPLKGPLL